ncbi:hypothetical protein ACNOYE_26150 [Nannocystaceae bacterium ST9]
MRTRLAPFSLALASLAACSPSGASRDPEALGYGPARRDLANGYVEAGPPFERPAPRAWPISEQPSSWAALAPVIAAPTLPEVSSDVRTLCVHVVEFLLAESGERFDTSGMAEVCHVQARTEKLARTEDQWLGFLGCMLAAKAEPEFDACEHDHPSALAGSSEHAREFEVCQHMVMTTLYEQLGSDTNLPASDLEQFRPVVDQCIEGLIQRERAERTPEAYAALLDCMLDQSTSVGMEACE